MQSIMNTVDMILLYIYTADFECHPYEEEEEEANLLLFFLVVLLLLELRIAFSYYLFLGTFAVVFFHSALLLGFCS